MFYQETEKPQLPITPGVYSVRKVYDKNFDYRIKNKETNTYVNDYNSIANIFTENINQLVSDIFNPDISFSQTQETRNCEYCPYKKICHR